MTGEKPRIGARFAVLCAGFIIILIASFFLGRYSVSLRELFARGTSATVLFNIRMPRIIACVVVGAALSLAGVSYQGMFRNPMVSPDILGASSGAGFGAALGILLSFGYFGISVSAFLFGLGSVLLAWCISRVSRLDQTLSMVLSGIVVSSLFSASTSFIKLIADTEDTLPAITYWLMGSMASIKWRDTVFVCIPVIIGAVPLFLLRWRINILTVSEDEAKSLGVNTAALRTAVIACATLITAASVAVSGMIGWVGLVIPHFCRLMFGYDYRRLIPASAIMGAGFLLAVDDIARVITTSELPLGILTSFVGAPVFVWLILKGGAAREH
ncbi:MAG: iron ABC transporter permease [Oscillospiraceae bacterium]|nr:iron ABC transporter permease [Oscillospiraceae bacterium]